MSGNLEHIGPSAPADPALAVVIEQLRWYSRAARHARVANQTSEVLQLVVAAATTVAAALAATAWVTAVMAAGNLVIAGLRKSFDWHENWVSFAATCSDLSSLINQYRLLPDDRRDEEGQRRLLASVDEVVSSETKTWAARRRTLQPPVQRTAP